MDNRRNEPPIILVKWYDVAKWLLERVESFPKNQRFVFGQRLADRGKSGAVVAGLRVRCVLDTHKYPPKVSVSNEQMATLHLVRDDFHGDWNSIIKPRER